jgi:hypothetical protein
MATVSFPKVPAKAWATLRARAAAAPSVKFTPSAVAAMLDMASPDSARDNVVSHIRKLGLIDEDGALTDRGNKWRIDSSYAEACQEILDELYPDELRGFSDAQNNPDTSQVTAWMQHKGLGASNARQMAVTYAMIASMAIPDAPSPPQPKKGSHSAPGKKAPRSATLKETSIQVPTSAESLTGPEPARTVDNGPNIHLDIQIHIPVEATNDQIDQIFASMAKHLYRK